MPRNAQKTEDAPVAPEPTVPEAVEPEVEARVADDSLPAPQTEDAPAKEPEVKVVLATDFNADGDVYVQIAGLPAELADEHDRFKVPTSPQAVPAEVAAALVESPAVEVAE